MIEFNNLNQEDPYILFKEKYEQALKAGQKAIEAISISSFNKQTAEVDSRYVNLKFVINDEFIFLDYKKTLNNNINGISYTFNNYSWSKLGGECAVQVYKNSLILR